MEYLQYLASIHSTYNMDLLRIHIRVSTQLRSIFIRILIAAGIIFSLGNSTKRNYS